MDWLFITLLVLSTFSGALIQSLTGFGFSIFAMCAFPLFFSSYMTASITTNMLSIALGIMLLIPVIKKVNIKSMITATIGYFIASTIVVIFSKNQSDDLLKKLLGVFLIVMSVYFFLKSNKIKLKPNPWLGVGCGLISGVTGGLFNVSGPPVIVYFLNSAKDTDEYTATIQGFFLASGVYLFINRAANGLMVSDAYLYFAIAFIALIPGAILGKKLKSKVKPEMLKKIVYIFMGLSGVVMLF